MTTHNRDGSETVQALLDRIAELEAQRMTAINQRDLARSDLAHVYTPANAERIRELEDQLADAKARADRAVDDRRIALSVTSRDGLLSSEWIMRTGRAERRATELESENAGLREIERFILACQTGVDCPHCDNSGGYPVQGSYGEMELQQCEWCYTFPHSKFNLQQLLEQNHD